MAMLGLANLGIVIKTHVSLYTWDSTIIACTGWVGTGFLSYTDCLDHVIALIGVVKSQADARILDF